MTKKYYDSPFSLAIKSDWEVFEKMVAMNVIRKDLTKPLREFESLQESGKPISATLQNKINDLQEKLKEKENIFNSIPIDRREKWEASVLQSMEMWCLKMTHKWKIWKGGVSSNEDVLQEARIGCLQAIRRISSLEMNQAYRYVERYCYGYAGKLINKNEKTLGDEISGDQPLDDGEGGGKNVFSLVKGENIVEHQINDIETEVLLNALKKHIEEDLNDEERFIVGTLFNIDVGNQKITFEKGEKKNIYSIAKNIGLSKYMARTTYESAMTKLRMAMLDFCSEDDIERIMSAAY